MTDNEKIEKLTESKPRYECELWVEEYFGLSPLIEQDDKIDCDYGHLVNLCAMVKERVIRQYVDAAFVAGRSKTSWEQFKKDYSL